MALPGDGEYKLTWRYYSSAIPLRTPYAIPGTDVAYDAITHLILGTDILSGNISLRPPYAKSYDMSSTDLAYGAASPPAYSLPIRQYTVWHASAMTSGVFQPLRTYEVPSNSYLGTYEVPK
eukprot:3856536-Rhodomonas_salina.4